MQQKLNEKTFLRFLNFNRQLLDHFENYMDMNTSRLQILCYLYNSDEIDQTAIKKYVEIDHAAVTRHLKSLESEGMIHRRTSTQDNRRTLVQLTEYGFKEVEISMKRREKFLEHMILNIKDTDIEQCLETIQKISDNLDHLDYS
ncbi:MarR family winged helix-turn-helix transcriptional regulator [Paenibacillus kyungheensis]